MTDGNASVAHAASQMACSMRDGVMDMEKLPAAESRTVAFEVLRNVGPDGRDANGTYLITEADTALIDALVGLGGRPRACPGARLARLEMRVVAEERHRRIPEHDVPRVPRAQGNQCLAGLAVWAHWHRQPPSELPRGGYAAR